MCPEMEFIGQRVYTYYFWCHIFKSFERRERERESSSWARSCLCRLLVGALEAFLWFCIMDCVCFLSLPLKLLSHIPFLPHGWEKTEVFFPSLDAFSLNKMWEQLQILLEFLADLGSQGGKLHQAGSGDVSTATTAQRLSWPETHDKQLTIRKYFQAQAEKPDSKTKGRSSSPA